jgi:hypothetical protein
VRTLPGPGFAGDDGSVSPQLGEALAAYDADPSTRYDETLSVLQDHRLLVPVVAVLGDTEEDAQGLPHDKTSDMAAVLMKGRDGRTALLAFTGTESLRRWDPQARPVPVSATDAARAAVQDGADALLVDVAGPVLLAVETDDLRELAQGNRLVRFSDRYGWVTPAR